MRPPYQITGKILNLVAANSEKIGEANSFHLNTPRLNYEKEQNKWRLLKIKMTQPNPIFLSLDTKNQTQFILLKS